MALSSRHPLARSLVAAAGPVAPAEGIVEHPGQGLSMTTPAGETRLGSRAFCGEADATAAGAGPEMWLARPHLPPVRFCFDERLRADAVAVAGTLRR